MVSTLHHWVISSSQKKFIHHSQKGYKYGNSNQKNRGMSLTPGLLTKWQLYDGWILRFSYFYITQNITVWTFEPPPFPGGEKIPYCEDVYKRLGTPAIFKISPLVSPDFDYMLENRGYSVQHVTNVMSVDLDKAVLDTPVTDVLFYR